MHFGQHSIDIRSGVTCGTEIAPHAIGRFLVLSTSLSMSRSHKSLIWCPPHSTHSSGGSWRYRTASAPHDHRTNSEQRQEACVRQAPGRGGHCNAPKPALAVGYHVESSGGDPGQASSHEPMGRSSLINWTYGTVAGGNSPKNWLPAADGSAMSQAPRAYQRLRNPGRIAAAAAAWRGLGQERCALPSKYTGAAWKRQPKAS